MSSKEELSATQRIVYILVSIILVVGAGIFSGLTLSFFSSLDTMYLRVQAATGGAADKARAKRILTVLKYHHLTLVTLLISNACAMTALPIFLERLLDPTSALIISMTAVLIFGEVIPQATFAKHAMKVCSFLAPLVWCFVGITFIVSYPLSKLLDKLVGHKSDLMEKDELGEFFQVHTAAPEGYVGLSSAEVDVMRGAMMLSKKKVKDVMKVPNRDVFMLAASILLNQETVQLILANDFSRIPICKDGEATHILGVLLVKSLLPLVFTNPDPPPRCGEYHLREVLRISEECVVEDLYESFQTGQSHMAVVYNMKGVMMGIITLEDVLQLLHSCSSQPETDEVRQRQLLELFGNVKAKTAKETTSSKGKEKAED